MTSYIPDRGDIIWLNFSPQVGREQKGKRPALILTGIKYNKKTGLLLACPITSKIKGFPFEVEVHAHTKIKGAILCDHVKSCDWKNRNPAYIGKIDKKTMEDVIEKITLLLNG